MQQSTTFAQQSTITATAPQAGPYRRAPAQVSVEVQTDFRETDVQTDPWTAPFDKQLENEHVELTSLIYLTFANRLLPAHEKTLQVIYYIEDERNFEAQIPPPLDLMRADFSQKELQQQQKRVQMQIEREKHKWDKIEAEMARNDQLRLERLVDKLETRARAREEVRGVQLNRIAYKFEDSLAVQREKQANTSITLLKMNTLAYKHNIESTASLAARRTLSDRLVLSHLGEPRLALPQQPLTRDAVSAAVHSANPLNAPILRPGEAPYRFAGVIRLAGTELKTQQDFDEILYYLDGSEDKLASDFARPKVYSAGKRSYAVSGENPLPKILPTPAAALQLSHKKRIQYYIQKQLEREGGRILETETAAVNKQQAFFYQDAPPVDYLLETDAALYLENLFRGFATQLRLQAGKGRRLGLVQELRLAHELVQTQGSVNYYDARVALLGANVAFGAITNAAASVIGQSLDAIFKNRERMAQVSRARALLEIAMRERARREQLESYLRQKEEMQRCRADFQLHQQVQTHRELVNAFVLSAQKKAVEKDAAERAKQLALNQISALVELDYEVSKQCGNEPQQVLQSILRDFLLPEVDRRVQAQMQAKNMQKIVLAGNLAATAARIASDNYQKDAQKSYLGRLEIDEKVNVGALVVRTGDATENMNDNQYGQQEIKQAVSKMEESCEITTKRWITEDSLPLEDQNEEQQ